VSKWDWLGLGFMGLCLVAIMLMWQWGDGNNILRILVHAPTP
jgi:hypothetical protein